MNPCEALDRVGSCQPGAQRLSRRHSGGRSERPSTRPLPAPYPPDGAARSCTSWACTGCGSKRSRSTRWCSVVEPASRAAVQRAAGCCLARLVVWCPTALTEPSHDMNIAAKAALKKRTSLTAADNDLSSTVTARQAHAASTALRAEPGAAAAGGASGGGGSETSLCLMDRCVWHRFSA